MEKPNPNPENSGPSGAGVHVLIAAGGTAGHVVPALAVAAELEHQGARVTFAGTPDRIESRLVPSAGYPFLSYRVRGLERRPSLSLVKSVAVDVVAPAACMRILRSTKPSVVFGAGGYVSGPMLAMAATLRLPSALLEVDAHMGIANRAASPLVRRVFLSFPIDGLRPPRHIVTGRPVPRAVLDADRAQSRAELSVPDDRPLVLVIGGSLGARTLNNAAADAWAQDDPGFTVINVTGSRDFGAIARRASPHYRVIEFTQSLGSMLAAADLVVSRAGGSVFEIAAAGRPSILVPSPNVTADHQTPNAAYLADGGAAVVVKDADLSPERLDAEVKRLLGEPARLEGMGAAARRLARPDAAATIAAQLLELAR
jgi:UDP-N-acetylglucosamine--N-acetylmuramyl-(pentapeptide) pyrophosphoryl-undecaprenol N-acetylglucosamine transferase